MSLALLKDADSAGGEGARVTELAMANISSNVLEFFMASFQIRDESLLVEHDN
jgi:hypothetical protein